MTLTAAETRAIAAQSLPAFRSFNLLGVKDAVAQALSLVGRNGIFREYTLHDASHVEGMLGILDWLLLDATKAAMTPADWLLQVLGIYLHDLGMVVTTSEFTQRDKRALAEFARSELFSGDTGADYEQKIESLGDEGDRIVFEEYIRFTHADRIADWILGRPRVRTGPEAPTASLVQELLAQLPNEFRADLALVCASHHKADLGDTRKYLVSQPYGDSEPETANVHFACLVLRSADLLHITRARTPSVLLRLINPQDPTSQTEWAKQAAVRRVRPQKGRDRDGNLSDAAAQDTIEVHATFTHPDGFFGLTSYLAYAGDQLEQTHRWAMDARQQYDVQHTLPWRGIDDSQVIAEGFLPEKLSFSLDQDRILDLLTGHTLYNDSSVVIRELIQNALDAVRLQALIGGLDSDSGKVVVTWDSTSRVLSIRDNGTGMSQDVIENNLLRAGASRYQEEGFRREFPGFSAISRFGIGVLSAFMIADAVEITTWAEGEPQGRQLTLRSVHGRYLVRLLDVDPEAHAEVAPHGTEIRLHVRSSADMPDVLATVRRWIVIPRCAVSVAIDDEDPIEVGFATVAEALREVVLQLGLSLASEEEAWPGAVRVVEVEDKGVTTAYAVQWSPFFKEWAFLAAPDRDGRTRLGTCVEGIRVEDDTPGYTGRTILAISNAVGPGSPKTNVARSGIENTPERADLLRAVYGAYLGHVENECDSLHGERGMSLTWAAQEVRYLLSPLMIGDGLRGLSRSVREGTVPVDVETLTGEAKKRRFWLVERSGERRLESAAGLASEGLIWTVDSLFVRAAERLLREVTSSASLGGVADGLHFEAAKLPEEPTLVGFAGLALAEREVARVVVRRDQRRVDLGWVRREGVAKWVRLDYERSLGRRLPAGGLFVALAPVEIEGGEDEIGVVALGNLFLCSQSPLTELLVKLADRVRSRADEVAAGVTANVVLEFFERGQRPASTAEFIGNVIEQHVGSRRILGERGLGLVSIEELVDALEATTGTVFDASAWVR